MRDLRKGSFMHSRVSIEELKRELAFIVKRVDWLQTQPRDNFGKLLREDDSNECSALISILDEKIAEVLAL
jgi:hypothetical protein